MELVINAQKDLFLLDIDVINKKRKSKTVLFNTLKISVNFVSKDIIWLKDLSAYLKDNYLVETQVLLFKVPSLLLGFNINKIILSHLTKIMAVMDLIQ